MQPLISGLKRKGSQVEVALDLCYYRKIGKLPGSQPDSPAVHGDPG